MKLPRDLSAADLEKALRREFGYENTRQVGSHRRLVTQTSGEHHLTIPGTTRTRLGARELPFPSSVSYGGIMSTITAILEPDVDGTMHLPLPAELRQRKIKVTAALESAESPLAKAKAGLWKEMPDRFWMSADFDKPLEDFREYKSGFLTRAGEVNR